MATTTKIAAVTVAAATTQTVPKITSGKKNLAKEMIFVRVYECNLLILWGGFVRFNVKRQSPPYTKQKKPDINST